MTTKLRSAPSEYLARKELQGAKRKAPAFISAKSTREAANVLWSCSEKRSMPTSGQVSRKQRSSMRVTRWMPPS